MIFLEFLNKVYNGEINHEKIKWLKINGDIYDAKKFLVDGQLDAEIMVLDDHNKNVPWSEILGVKNEP